MRLRTAWFFLLSGSASLGCAEIAGLDQYDASSSGTAATTTSSGGTTASSGSGGSTGGSGGTTTASGGGTTTASSGGSTTSGSGGSVACTPAAVEACTYSGPELTQDVGLCKAATRTCGADGVWGACSGEVLPAIESCATLAVDESCDNLAQCTGQFRWAKRFGSLGPQIPASVAACPDGGVVVVGEASGDLDFDGNATADHGGKDLFLVKLDRHGKYLWSRRFGDPAAQSAVAVDVAPNGNIVVAGNGAGSFTVGGPTALTVTPGVSNAFVAAYSPAGEHLWSTLVGDAAGGASTSVATDADGNVVVAGHDDLSPRHLWLVKLAALTGAPDPLWPPKTFTATDDTSRITRVLVHRDGPSPSGDIAVVAVGKAGITFDLDPVSLNMPGGDDVFLARFDKNGGHLWSRPYGGIGNESGFYDMAMNSAGAVFVIGTTDNVFNFYLSSKPSTGTADVVVWKVGPGGSTNWTLRLVDAGPQWGHGIAVDAAGNLLVAGTFQSSITFGLTVLAAPTPIGRFVAKLDSAGSGTAIWARSFGSGDSSDARLAADPLGNIFYASLLAGETNLGGGPLAPVSPGDPDILIGSFAP